MSRSCWRASAAARSCFVAASSDSSWERSRRSARQEKKTARASSNAKVSLVRWIQYLGGIGLSRMTMLVVAQHAAPLQRGRFNERLQIMRAAGEDLCGVGRVVVAQHAAPL